MAHVTFGSKKIQFAIRKSKRKKTIAIQVQPNSTVIVLTPQLIEVEKIKKIVLKRAKWIIKKQEILRQLKNNVPQKDFVSGETFPFLGRQYRLKVIRSASEYEKNCGIHNRRLHVLINSNLKDKAASKIVRKKLIEWYTEQAKEKINERIQKYSKSIGQYPKKIIIKNQEKRWGSCSHSGTLRLNWKTVMMPISVFDYIIVHELCHLIYPNHSKKFWQTVATIIPNFKRYRDWLRKNSPYMLELL